MLHRLPLRMRLVAGFAAAMLAVLVAAGGFVYWRVESTLDRGLDTQLIQATSTIRPLLQGATVRNVAEAEATGVGWQVVDAAGLPVSRGGEAPTRALVNPRQLARAGHSPIIDIGDILDSGATWRVQITPLGSTYLVVEVRRDHRDEALRELLAQLAVAGFGALVVTSVVGDLLARFALRPVERYRRRAEEIAGGAGNLRLDVPVDRDDEVTRLGHTLNDMLAVLEEAVERERHFVNDASHELRTPLTLLKSRIQLARRRDRTIEEHERILDELAIDVGRLAALAEDLLELGSVAGQHGVSVDAGRIAAAVVEHRRVADPRRAAQLEVVVPPAPVLAATSSSALERIITNLVENAFLHGRPPVRVTVEAPDAAWVRIEVVDAGDGMTDELLHRATGRFTRSDEARSRPGAGLGLALVEQLVVAAGGQLRLCAGGRHVSHGVPVPFVCAHGATMTATVLLPHA
ncbi:MAG TPA: HAMP domain-containing sensor histidine kinase [Nocardioides sp.]|nr:HAMP domain-containing sensor histidine kinase [Nocardioides sp.]